MELEHTFSEEDTMQHIKGLQDSADLIDRLIADGVKNDETRNTMDRNVRHIGIMCAMDHVKNCGNNLQPYLDAQHRGTAWMAS